jgi:hypothetical protein
VQIDWTDYQRVHANRSNLLIHLLAVPLFIGVLVFVILAASRGDFASIVIGALTGVVAMVLQGQGHKLEDEAPRPFTGPLNFLKRWFTEQFVIFPLFLLSGRWWRQFRRSGRIANHES